MTQRPPNPRRKAPPPAHAARPAPWPATRHGPCTACLPLLLARVILALL
ncbi:MAG TPA: hypothetical protein PKZ20_17270 [Rhodocyclaceae bacterium]|nr:hypothetical protein [Rhodocyclaceae bacterium]HNF63486.1 hypothetical protein [Rhodocyclaceae bacterium]